MKGILNNKNLSLQNLIISYGGWWVGHTAVQVIVLHYSLALDLPLAIKDSILTNLIIAIASYAMINIIRFYQPRQWLRLIDSVVISIVAIFIFNTIAKLLIDDLQYHHFLDQSFMVRCLFAWMMISLFSASASLWYYLRDEQENQNRKSASEKLAREAELSRIRQQLQPHFLFNSLNSISALAGSNPEQARKMIQQLSDFLRGTLRKDDQQLVTLKEELDHLELYLEIEKVRFGHRLKTFINMEDESLSKHLPSLLLQPVVENAIKFGLYDNTGEIIIRLTGKADTNNLCIQVENPFDPSTATPRQGTGFGLTSVQRRLYLLYGRQDLLSTSQHENIFTTTLNIPQTT